MDTKTITAILCIWICAWPLLAVFFTPAVMLWMDRTGRLDRILARLQRNRSEEE
jgi:hypothetical protein